MTIKEIYDLGVENSNKAYQIFVNFFKEDRVDLQIQSFEEFRQTLSRYCTEDRESIAFSLFRADILVWFPHVVIENEYGKRHDILDLYAKIKVDYRGTLAGGFTLNRATYTTAEILSGYMHSHIPGIPTNNFTQFQNPCTGTGPINSTISSLNREFDEDIWNLFCLELDKYVTVESIAGVPYRRMENIGFGGAGTLTFHLHTSNHSLPVRQLSGRIRWYNFIVYLIRNFDFKLNYINGSYGFGYTHLDLQLTISKLFIDWYNKEYKEGREHCSTNQLLGDRILRQCKLINGGLVYGERESSLAPLNNYQGKDVCTFKGKPITINIVDLNTVRETQEDSLFILNSELISSILYTLLELINIYYGKTDAIDSSKKVKII